MSADIHRFRSLPGPRLLAQLPAALMLLAFSAGGPARAQMSMPDSPSAPDGKALFRNQCATCHADAKDAPGRQGPNLYGVVGRKAGTEPGFQYSSGFAKAGFVWDEAHLDAWLTNPQAVIPGAVMLYRQAKPAVRHAVIQYLTDQK